MPAATFSEIISRVNRVVGDRPRPVALHEPFFGGREKEYVASCIDAGWVSSAGAFVERFEQELAQACGARRAVATVNGTAALHAALVVSGVEPGDEVLVPSLTFVATANAVCHAGATPNFVEAEEVSLGICPDRLRRYLARIAIVRNGMTVHQRTGRVIRAIVPVHVFGHPCQMEALRVVTEQYPMAVIEDATEALGSGYSDAAVGCNGMAVLSFNGNKIITTGGGGAVLVQDDATYARLKHLTTTAKRPHAWAFEHDAVAWNYRLPNLNAALGCAQLQQLSRFVAVKRALAQEYMRQLEDCAGYRVLAEPPGTRSNYWLVTLLAPAANATHQHQLLQALHHEGLLCRPLWTPLHLLPMYRDAPRDDLTNTESLAHRIINLPSSVALGVPYADAP